MPCANRAVPALNRPLPSRAVHALGPGPLSGLQGDMFLARHAGDILQGDVEQPVGEPAKGAGHRHLVTDPRDGDVVGAAPGVPLRA